MHPDTRQVQRVKVLTLHIDAAFSKRAISRQTGIPLTTVSRIITVYQETGRRPANRKGKCGRKRHSTSSHDCLIVRASSANPKMTAVDDVWKTGTSLSLRTVQRRVNEGGRFAKKTYKKASSYFKND